MPITQEEFWVLRQALIARMPKMMGIRSRQTTCPQCKNVCTTKHVFEYCDECSKCIACKNKPWVSEDAKRCEDCVCNMCWDDSTDLQPDHLGNYLCRSCRTQTPCALCGRAKATVKTRKNKKRIDWCGRCVAYNQLQCTFCFGRAHTVTRTNGHGTVTVCTECRRKACCYAGNCTPVKQCPKCQTIQHEQAIQEHQQHQGGPYISNPIVFHEPDGIKDRRYNRSTRFAGIEIEIASFEHTQQNYDALKNLAKKWSASIVYDGSLPQEGSYGIEINTAPAAGDLLLKQIDEWTDLLKQIKATVNNQCGLHVHIDARDHKMEDLRKLIRYYAFLEPALIRTQPFARIMEPNPTTGRFYCRPCGQTYVRKLDEMTPAKSARIYAQATKQKILDNIYGAGAGRPMTSEHYANAKYHAFNLHSYFYGNRRTVESRLHTGTILPRKIKDWTLLWIAIVDTAYATPEKQLRTQGNVDAAITELLRIAPSNRCKEYIMTRIADFGARYDEMDRSTAPTAMTEEIETITDQTAVFLDEIETDEDLDDD